jgi:hypothetical protein
LAIAHLCITLDFQTPLKFSRERQKLGSLFPIIRSFPKSGPAPLVDFPEPLALVPAGFFLPMLPRTYLKIV